MRRDLAGRSLKPQGRGQDEIDYKDCSSNFVNFSFHSFTFFTQISPSCFCQALTLPCLLNIDYLRTLGVCLAPSQCPLFALAACSLSRRSPRQILACRRLIIADHPDRGEAGDSNLTGSHSPTPTALSPPADKIRPYWCWRTCHTLNGLSLI